jgi:hypothetical protein
LMTSELVLINLLKRPLFLSEDGRKRFSHLPPPVTIDVQEKLVLVQLRFALMSREHNLPPFISIPLHVPSSSEHCSGPPASLISKKKSAKSDLSSSSSTAPRGFCSEVHAENESSSFSSPRDGARNFIGPGVQVLAKRCSRTRCAFRQSRSRVIMLIPVVLPRFLSAFANDKYVELGSPKQAYCLFCRPILDRIQHHRKTGRGE